MANARRSIFRNHALQQYVQRQEKEVLPRVVQPPAFVFYGILLGLFLIAGCLAWYEKVPTYIAGSGVMLEYGTRLASGQNGTLALLFLPAIHHPKVHIGLPVRIQIGTGPYLTGRVEKIESGIISPSEASTRYHLARNRLRFIIIQPSIVLLISTGALVSSHISTGSPVHAQVQDGSQSVLSLLLNFSELTGG